VPGRPLASTVDAPDRGAGDHLTQVVAVAALEVHKLCHDPIELLTRAAQPVLWLMLFGEVVARVRCVAPGDTPYLDFLAAGIVAQSAPFVAIFYGISTIWERDLGILQRLLVSPALRSPSLPARPYRRAFARYRRPLSSTCLPCCSGSG
jgi:ABC-2 type transport system permease protein